MASRLPRYCSMTSSGRGLQDHLELRVLVEAVGIVAIAAVGGTAAGLHIRDAVRLGAEHAEERLRSHGAGADLDVVRLLDDDGPRSDQVSLQLEDGLLKRIHAGAHRVSNTRAVIRRRSM